MGEWRKSIGGPDQPETVALAPPAAHRARVGPSAAGGAVAPGAGEGSGKLSRDANQRLKTLTNTMAATVAENGTAFRPYGSSAQRQN